MAHLDFERMQQLQVELQEKYRDKWESITPESAKRKLLWLFVEAGEMADVIKKQGDSAIMDNLDVRRHFIEEACDTLMYLNDILRCYQITPQELEDVYLAKHERNMRRW